MDKILIKSRQLTLVPLTTRFFRTMSNGLLSNFNFEDISKLVLSEASTKITLVDVRTKTELQETGVIPTTHSVPLQEIKEAFSLDPIDFEKKYGFPKPPKDVGSKLVLTSKNGGQRVQEAIKQLRTLGYNDLGTYNGSFSDWTANNGKVDEFICANEITFDELSKALEPDSERKLTIIDIRPVNEVDESGMIPKSYNIPYDEIKEAFSLDPSEFNKKYGFPRPPKDKGPDLIFVSRSGSHIKETLRKLRDLGYYNLGSYPGGFVDWTAKNGKVIPHVPHSGVKYEDLEQLISSESEKKINLIDVRKRSELEELGMIPTSHCVPKQEIEEAFKMDPAEFNKKYGFPKPPPEIASDIIVYCKSGRRAENVVRILFDLGYKNLGVYPGSFDDWVKNGGKVDKYVPQHGVNFEELSKLISPDSERKITLIDVRTRKELEELGIIPTSHNVPLQEISEAFQMDPMEFNKKYGFPKPPNDVGPDLIFYCRSGRRVQTAIRKLHDLGYCNLGAYPGSFNDWTANHGKVVPYVPQHGVNFQELSELISPNSQRKITLVDVRTRKELVEKGMIPSSHVIPVQEIKEAFKMEPAEFEGKYGFPKPEKDIGPDLIFYCRSGRRVQDAIRQLHDLGYHNLGAYPGSFLDWTANNGKIVTFDY